LKLWPEQSRRYSLPLRAQSISPDVSQSWARKLRGTIDGRHVALGNFVTAKIAEIEKATIAQMREIWERELSSPLPPIRAYGVLKRILAWRVQEKYLGGVSQSARQQLDRLVAALDRDPKGESATRGLRPGLVLVREWKGTKHQVRVLPEGFEHLGKVYDSLSIVARHITGTRWSGPLFFGLKKTGRQTKK